MYSEIKTRKTTLKRHNIEQEKLKAKKIKYITPKTKGQTEYIRTIAENDITLCYGCSGTGKTAIAINLACQYFMEGKVDKILVTRPIVATSVKNIGALPGDVREKIDPYLIPLMEEMVKYFGNRSEVEKQIRDKIIELAPLELMRGRTFDRCFMVADEMQNATYEQIKMFLTRIGDESRMVINGDTDQTDLKMDAGGFQKCIELLDGVTDIGICELTQADIVRNPIIKRILGALS